MFGRKMSAGGVAAVVFLWFGLQCALYLDPKQILAPPSWAVVSVCIWLAYILVRGWHTLGTWDRRQFLWGVFSAVCFLNFLQLDQEFTVSEICCFLLYCKISLVAARCCAAA